MLPAPGKLVGHLFVHLAGKLATQALLQREARDFDFLRDAAQIGGVLEQASETFALPGRAGVVVRGTADTAIPNALGGHGRAAAWLECRLATMWQGRQGTAASRDADGPKSCVRSRNAVEEAVPLRSR